MELKLGSDFERRLMNGWMDGTNGLMAILWTKENQLKTQVEYYSIAQVNIFNLISASAKLVPNINFLRIFFLGTNSVVQWLRLHTPV